MILRKWRRHVNENTIPDEPVHIGGKTFQRSDKKYSQKELDALHAEFAEHRRRREQISPENRYRPSGRFGDSDFLGTEFEGWVAPADWTQDPVDGNWLDAHGRRVCDDNGNYIAYPDTDNADDGR